MRRAVADRVDADPSGDRVRGGLQRGDAPVVGPVGQQHDDVGDVAFGSRLRSVPSCRVPPDRSSPEFGRSGLGAQHRVGDRLDLGIDLGDGVERLQDRRPDGGAGAGRQVVERVIEGAAIGRRRDGELGEPVEQHQTDLGAARLGVDELERPLLGHGQSVRVEVGGAHRARLVERQDDRRLLGRHVLGELGSRRRDRQHADGGEQRGHGHVPEPATPSGNGGAQQREARVRDRLAASPAQCDDVQAQHDGNGEQEEQREGPGEAHLTSPARTTAPRAAPPTTRSSMAAAAKRAEISMCSLTTVKCRSMVWDTSAHRGAVVDLVVGPVRDLGDVLERLRIQRGGDAEPLDLHRRAGDGADADRLDAHPRGRRQPGHRHRVDLHSCSRRRRSTRSSLPRSSRC